MTPYEKTQRRIQRLEQDIDRVSKQVTFDPALRRRQLEKLTVSLTAQKRKLARLAAKHA